MTDPITAISAIALAMRGLRQGKKPKYYKTRPQNNNVEYYTDEKGQIKKRKKK